MIPYILMAALFLVLAVLAAFESSLAGMRLANWFGGMVWLRVHLITLGALTQMLFGGLPLISAIRLRLPRPATRWDIWVALNAGILALLVGIPQMSPIPIIAGGTLVFAATVLLLVQLSGLRRRAPASATGHAASAGNRFYLAGLAYFLVGIVIGTGMWNGWMKALGVVGNSKEVHIHANSWGLMSLVFAGLLVDLYPTWTGKPLATPRAIERIFWLMTAGAFGLIFGPWLANLYLLVPGLVLHLAATVWLLVSVIRPLWPERRALPWGMRHIITAYFWILAPVLMAPVVLLEVPGIPGRDIEAYAPQALIYGWALQFGFALLPYLFAKGLAPDAPAPLGGSRWSWWLVNLGSVVLWASIFAQPVRTTLYGGAYLLWTAALLPIVGQLWRILRDGLARLETASSVASAGAALE